MSIPDYNIDTENMIFYAVYSTKYDFNIMESDFLCTVREKYFSSQKKLRNKKLIYRGASLYQYSYNISKKAPMKWKKLKDGVLLENIENLYNKNYAVCSYSCDNNSLAKRILFSENHSIIANEYYIKGNKKPSEVLSIVDNNRIKLTIFHDSQLEETMLYLCEYNSDPYKRKKLINSFGEPEVIVKTNMGTLYFCNKELVNKFNSLSDKSIPNNLKNQTKPENRLRNNKNDIKLTYTAKNNNQKNHFNVNNSEKENLVDNKIFNKLNRDNMHYEKKINYTLPEENIEQNNSIKFQEIDCSDNFADCPYVKMDKLKIKSSNEDFYYFGETKDNQREGMGHTLMSNGNIAYSGAYKSNKRDGFGTYHYADGKLCYVGNWKGNKKNGVGIQFYLNDNFSVGNWVDNSLSGNCALFDNNGCLVYFGKIVNGKKMGGCISCDPENGTIFIHKGNPNNGFLFSSDGQLIYKGQLSNGQKDGLGTLYDKNERIVYTGMFKNNKFNGRGTLRLKNGHNLEAAFKYGVINSDVKETDKSGFVIYKGGWRNNYDGHGCCYFKNGGRYEGTFKNGKPKGFLKGYNKENELVYEGEWENNHFSGHGIYYLKGEKFYEGTFKDDNFHGNGFLYNNGEYIYSGGFLHSKKSGYGTSYIDHKPFYSGEWKNNLYDGVGAVFENNEIVLCGEFSHGKKNGRINLIKNNVVCEEQIYKDDELIFTKKFDVKDPNSIKLIYMGNIKNNLPNGMGCFFDECGTKKAEGMFSNGKLIKPMKVRITELKELPVSKYLGHTNYNSYRKHINFVIEKNLSNGCIYTGMLDESNLPIGLATALFSDHIYIGYFKNGIANGNGLIYKSNGLYLKGQFLKEKTSNSVNLIFAQDIKYICIINRESSSPVFREANNENRKN